MSAQHDQLLSPVLPSPGAAAGSGGGTDDAHQHGDGMFNLDFLSFAGLDSSQIDSPQLSNAHTQAQQSEPGPSNASIRSVQSVASAHSGPASSSASTGSRRNSTTLDEEAHRSPSLRGRSKGRSAKRSAGTHGTSTSLSRSHTHDTSMEVDASIDGSSQQAHGMSFGGVHGVDPMNGLQGMSYGLQSGEYDALQAGMLQQLEHIHMQSPIVFDPTNPHSPYTTMAQMFVASPNNNIAHGDENHQQSNGNHQDKWRSYGGLVTPGPSGEMFPQPRADLMSPMPLEIMAREGIDPADFNIIPLLSPALSHHQHSTSAYASPNNQAAFSGGPGLAVRQQNFPSADRSPIEQLQEQQRQFQEQLLLLQEQQRQLQATAAAVVASASPYLSSSGGSGPTTQQVTTPGVNTPTHAFFSPLTSPALEATARAGHMPYQSYSPALGSHSGRPPHPLSTLSSPALNPIGSSGGAQQTLSPALEPQANNDLSDPDYLRALVGLLDSHTTPDSQQPMSAYQSPVTSAVTSSTAFNNAVHPPPHQAHAQPSSGGPHRQSLPLKSRPSPMMKPTNHRGTHRPSGSQGYALPTSPMVNKYAHAPVPGTGYLPPSAFDQKGVQAHQQQQASVSGASLSSTPSPVDLSQIMPPPPVPAGAQSSKGVTPMTPASLMNLANGSPGPASGAATPVMRGESTAVPLPKRQAATKAVTAVQSAIRPNIQQKRPVNGSGSSAGAVSVKRGSKLVPSAAGKRALAIRPQGVGVRAATKGAAAAAALVPPEGETRRTSHKAAEQKRRDSLKAGFDELRLLLPAINTEALDPESGEPIPGSSAPRLLPKSSLVPDDNPNRGVSKVALLKFSNEYIVRLHDKVEKRDGYIDRLRDEVRRLRAGEEGEVTGEDGQDLLDMDMLEGEEDDLETDEEGDDGGSDVEDDEGEDDEDMEDESKRKAKKGKNGTVKRSPALRPTKQGASSAMGAMTAVGVKGRA